ncbi:hypothetical protein [Paenibacillus crassostreae]|nr:hypothetical protein [Paenibacillus crassostreae]
MKKGKSALKGEEYEEAVSHFKNALIEKPQDEDGKLLLEQSEESYHTELANKEISGYIDAVSSPVDRFVYILNTDNSVETISNQDLEEQLQELDLIEQELQKVSSNFDGNPIIIDLHTRLIKAVGEYITGTNQMKELLPTLKENAENAKKESTGYPFSAIDGVGSIASMKVIFSYARSDYDYFINGVNNIQ